MTQQQAPYITRDYITDRFFELSTMNVIEDVYKHAEDWQRLSIICMMAGRPATADNCVARVRYWCNQSAAEYIRIVTGNFSELIPTAIEVMK